MSDIDKVSALALQNPEYMRMQLDKADASEGLLAFVKMAWHVLEPETELKIGWVLMAICDHLEAVTRGDLNRLLCNVPPGSMKSLLFNVFWPAWEWGPKGLPSTRYVSTAFSENLAKRDNNKARHLISSEWYQARWGDIVTIAKDQDEKKKFANTKMGVRECMPFTKMTGTRGDRVIIDDPIPVKEADSDIIRNDVNRTFRETIPTRVNDPDKSAIVAIMQRVHQSDLSGEIISKELGYEHLMVPMEFEPERRCYSIVKPSYIKNPKRVRVYYDSKAELWTPEIPDLSEGEELQSSMRYAVDPRTELGELMFPERFSAHSVAREKKTMGSYAIASQFQQRPAPRGGGMFKRADFGIVDICPKDLAIVSRGWDLAATEGSGDFTVGLKMGKDGEGRIFIVDVRRGQWGPYNVEQKLQNAASFDGNGVRQAIPQDPAAAGKTQKAAIARLLQGYDVKFTLESGDKEVRARPFAAQVEAGNVFIVRGAWNDDYLEEMCVFPAGKYDDQVDASSRAYGDIISRRSSSQSFAGPQLIKA